MNTNRGLPLVSPRLTPVLDPAFRPAVLANRAFRQQASALSNAVPVRLALEQTDGVVSRFVSLVFPDGHPLAAGNLTYLERIAKLMLWSRGGFRLYVDGPPPLASALAAITAGRPQESSTPIWWRSACSIILWKSFPPTDLPAERGGTAALGRHLEGCRIGFDLGGSDRKVARSKR